MQVVRRRIRAREVLGWMGWLVAPLVGGIQCVPFVLVMFFVVFGVQSSLVEIPPKDQLTRVDGRLLARYDTWPSKRSQYATRVRSADGVVHRCSCALGWSSTSNCLDENDVRLNDQYAEHLRSQQVSLLMAPASKGRGDLCYELSNAEKTWFHYEENARKYTAIQSGWGPALSWVLLVLLGAFIAIRGIFFRRQKPLDGMPHGIPWAAHHSKE